VVCQVFVVICQVFVVIGQVFPRPDSMISNLDSMISNLALNLSRICRASSAIHDVLAAIVADIGTLEWMLVSTCAGLTNYLVLVTVFDALSERIWAHFRAMGDNLIE